MDGYLNILLLGFIIQDEFYKSNLSKAKKYINKAKAIVNADFDLPLSINSGKIVEFKSKTKRLRNDFKKSLKNLATAHPNLEVRLV